MWADAYDYSYDEAAGRMSLRSIPLSSAYCRRQAETFLLAQGLQMPRLDYMAGVFDDDDRLLACGGLDCSTIKGLAVCPEARQLNLAAKLVTHLRAYALEAGHRDVTVFTKPANIPLFRSMGFSLIGESSGAALLETDRMALPRYLDHLRSLRPAGPMLASRQGLDQDFPAQPQAARVQPQAVQGPGLSAPPLHRCGVVVMNCNPLTRGHLYLIGQARRRCGHLVIVPVADNPLTLFGYSERRAMLQAAVEGLDGVSLAEASIYTVSRATFPTYFIKEKSQRALAHIELDLNIFARHLAPALGATVRFVGTEPTDALTAAYNAAMHRLLPPAGIEVVEIARQGADGDPEHPVSASELRQALAQGHTERALRLAAPQAVPYVLAQAAAIALRTELDLTPKPGLVDRRGAGAHRDMSHALMVRSIEALRPTLLAVARAAYGPELPRCAALMAIGIAGEEQMLRATGGVNTHRGALFALGLATAAAAHLLHTEGRVRPDALQRTIRLVAADFKQPPATHGALARQQYRVGGALGNALGGYAGLFDSWLPFLQAHEAEPYALHRLLLRIIATLDDTNLLHRAGGERAAQARLEAARAEAQFTPEALEALCRDFTARNLSPGGAADMLALTVYVKGLISDDFS